MSYSSLNSQCSFTVDGRFGVRKRYGRLRSTVQYCTNVVINGTYCTVLLPCTVKLSPVPSHECSITQVQNDNTYELPCVPCCGKGVFDSNVDEAGVMWINILVSFRVQNSPL